MIPLQLQLFSLVATKLPSLQQSLARGVGLAVSRTGLPDSLVGLDLAMEWVNRDCKGPCRLASFLQPEARGRFLYTLPAVLRLAEEMPQSVATTFQPSGARGPRVQPKILRDMDQVSGVLARHVGPLSGKGGPEIQTLFSHAVVQLERTANILSGTPAAAEQAIQLDRQRLRAESTSVPTCTSRLHGGEIYKNTLLSNNHKPSFRPHVDVNACHGRHMIYTDRNPVADHS